jgi:DNA repair exonuclease SbcCD ATPase subunit
MSKKVKPYEQKITIVQKFVPEEIYNETVKENEVLKTRLHELTQENDNLRSNNLKLELTIDELRHENEFLKSKIVELENKINKLEIDNKELRIENKELKVENKNLVERLNRKDKKEMINKFLQAFQDINRFEQFEKKCPSNTLPSLVKVRRSRNSNSHLAEPDINAFDRSCAYVALFRALENISPDIQSELETKYPGVIDFYRSELIKIVQPKDYSEEDLEPFVKYFEI